MKPVLLSLPFVGHRHGPRAYGYPPQMEQVPLPFPAEAARGRGHKNAVTDGDRVLDDEGAPTLASLGVSKRESSERRMGELLKRDHDQLSKGARGNPGGRGAPIVRSPDDTAQAPTLASLGVSKRESSEAQKLAELDSEKGRVERYRALFATVAANACSLAVSVAAGVLTSEEALVVMRRHAKRLQVDLAALENEAQP